MVHLCIAAKLNTRLVRVVKTGGHAGEHEIYVTKRFTCN
jgi:hypothetical protein